MTETDSSKIFFTLFPSLFITLSCCGFFWVERRSQVIICVLSFFFCFSFIKKKFFNYCSDFTTSDSLIVSLSIFSYLKISYGLFKILFCRISVWFVIIIFVPFLDRFLFELSVCDVGVHLSDFAFYFLFFNFKIRFEKIKMRREEMRIRSFQLKRIDVFRKKNWFFRKIKNNNKIFRRRRDIFNFIFQWWKACFLKVNEKIILIFTEKFRITF